MRPLRIYVASPYTRGDQAANVRRAMDEFIVLLDSGLVPFCPLLTHFVDIVHPRTYEVWLACAMAWIPVCDALLRLPGRSKGAKQEEKLAKSLGIPIFHNRKDLLTWANLQ